MLDTQSTLDALLDWVRTHYFGKYRGSIVETEDPTNRGRLKVKVPDVLGPDTTVWAMPSVPYAGEGVGFKFFPPPDTNVWIEFEKGDISYPIWTGFFWADGEMPQEADTGDNVKLLQTENITVRIDDEAGEIVIKSASGTSITLTDIINADGNGSTIEISAASIDLDAGATVQVGTVSVNVNNGSLTVD